MKGPSICKVLFKGTDKVPPRIVKEPVELITNKLSVPILTVDPGSFTFICAEKVPPDLVTVWGFEPLKVNVRVPSPNVELLLP